MKNQITSVAAAIALLAFSDGADARKQLVDANENRLVTRESDPVVGTETCEDYCVYGKDNTQKVYWCFAFSEPVVTFGWEYKQDANTSAESTPLKHLRFDLIYYLQHRFKITSTADIFRLYYNQAIIESPQTDWKIEFGMIMNERWQYCPHLSWKRGSLGVNSTYRQEFMNCSKVFMKNPWDYEGVWTGKYARYFEECSRSQAGSNTSSDPQVTATFYKKDFFETLVEQVILGTTDPESNQFCYKIAPFIPTYDEILVDPTATTNESYGFGGSLIEGESGEFAMFRMAYKVLFEYFYGMDTFQKTGNYSLF